METAYSLLLSLIWAVVWGLVTDKIIKNKGYENNWFWWGFFFGWIAFVLALTKPDINTQQNNSHQYDNSYQNNTNSPLSAESAKRRREEQIRAGFWECSCGSFNPPYCTTCLCGRTPKDVIAEKKNIQNVQPTKKEDEELKNINLLKEYKELLDAGVITQEEFEQKKAKILNL